HGGSAVGPAQVQQQTTGATPSPPSGAVVLAREVGTRAVALAVQRKTLTATVLSPSGGPDAGLKVAFRASGSTVGAHACGPGCYRATVATPPRRGGVVLAAGAASVRIRGATRPVAAMV